MVVQLLLVVLAGSLLLPPSRGEVFTALVHMEGLLSLEKDLLQGLNSYIAQERRRLQSLEEFAERVKRVSDVVGDDPSSHLFDPVNAFQLVNRYFNGWMTLHDNVYQDNAQDLMANISMNRYRFPSKEDYSGAITAIHRLQDTYQLQPSVIASGKLGSSSAFPMTAQDCFAVGRQAYLNSDWDHTRTWMKEALSKFDDGGEGSEIDLGDVYDHLAYAEFQLGNVKRAAQYTRELLQNDPYHERGLSNLAYFDSLKQNSPEKFTDGEETEGANEATSEQSRYKALCREPEPIPAKDHHKLTCYYYNNNRNPRLLLRPAKIEVVFPEPRIYMLRGVISEPEMGRLKELAEPILNRATVHDANGNLIHATYRISKSGWLSDEDDPQGYVTRINQRLEDITGLTMETAEQLQVVNYGIGGHYEPHYDFARRGEDAFSSLGAGNRIATVLFYMSDVELGGATVFPLVGARIAPSRGDASFWWNLKKSGEGDYLTRHAGCPVLVGSKWVCNKWIHERGQEFRRPCALSPEE